MKYLLLAFLASLTLAGCGGEVDLARTPAGAAQVRFVEDLYKGRFAQAYAALHPVHQKIVSRSMFAQCARTTIPVGKLDSIEVLDVFDETVRIPGLGKQRTKAVRVRLTSSAGETFTLVNHEVKVGNRWRWVLNDNGFRAYRASRCPSA